MTCTVDGCARRAYCQGLCRGHYRRHLAGESTDSPLRGYGLTPRAALREAALGYADADASDDAAYRRAEWRLYWAARRLAREKVPE